MFVVFEITQLPGSGDREALNTWLPLGSIAFKKEEDAWKYVESFINAKVDAYKASYTILNKWGYLSPDATLESYLHSVLDISFAERSVEITEELSDCRTKYLIAEYKVQ